MQQQSAQIIRLILCQACGYVVHKPRVELAGVFHEECWNEFVCDMWEISQEQLTRADIENAMEDDTVFHDFTPTQRSGSCVYCEAPSEDLCFGEHMKQLIDD